MTIPPEMAQALAGQGPPPRGGPPQSITSDERGERTDQLRLAIRSIQLYLEGETDDQEIAKLHKCIVAIQSVLADHAKDSDAAMGISPTLRHVRRTSGSY